MTLVGSRISISPVFQHKMYVECSVVEHVKPQVIIVVVVAEIVSAYKVVSAYCLGCPVRHELLQASA